ncbi:hypothetical protein RMCBS344292_18065 [Rhizopus microsporus]|nr:hypothetical protein RMCBS344292_18065 [Rhizopus microsporus]
MSIYPVFDFTPTENNHFEVFEAYKYQTPSAYCAFCVQLLYPDEVKYMMCDENENTLPCVEWGFRPLYSSDNNGLIVVCKARALGRGKCTAPVYCGPTLGEELNYRERGATAPMKLMCRTTRLKSRNKGYCGHYQVTGSMWTERNLEFGEIVYGGTLGMPYIKNLDRVVNTDKVRSCLRSLCDLIPRINQYLNDEMRDLYRQVNLKKLIKSGEILNDESWPANYIMPIDDLPPNAGEQEFQDVLLGALGDTDVRFKDHADILVLLFPYLYGNGCGYYTFAAKNASNDKPESEGGYCLG